MEKFLCDCCGKCCEHLDLSPLYVDLDDGTGMCIHYDYHTHLCKIYAHRPLKCNVEAMYRFFANKISWSDYLAENRKGCLKLKSGEL